ncbi:hypothetical protein niasHT_035056 [Heterodera trifolii]|uniref:Uncharacterized protein n=1 Tax=Heterodera trifolii TaxID=157864 RepID=A0ABD2IW26_9BILA
MFKIQLVFILLISFCISTFIIGKEIRKIQRSARWSGSPMLNWSSMFAPMPGETLRIQNRKIDTEKLRQPPAASASIDTNAKWMAKMAAQQKENANDKKEQEEEEEPLVYSSYNRDCFFTPVNCFVGRAGQQATKIIGTAFNSKRQILFIRRMPK